jgi:hypothetical protein
VRGQQRHSRFGVVALEPPRRNVVRLNRPLRISNLQLIHLREILLMRRRSPEVPLRRVVSYRLLEHSSCIFRIRLPVRLEGFREGVRCVVGLVELFYLDLSRAFECEAGFPAYVGVLGLGDNGPSEAGEGRGSDLASASERRWQLACRGPLHFRIFRFYRRIS